MQRNKKINMKKMTYIIIGLIVFILIIFIIRQQKNNLTLSDVRTSQEIQIVSELISPDQFKELAETGNYTVIDIRTPKEINEGKIIDTALEIDFYEETFKDEISKLDRDKEYILYCRSGNRSGKTLKIMKDLGFTEVYDLDGGKKAWDASGLLLEINL